MNSEELQAAYGGNRLVEAPSNSFERVREFMQAFGHPVYEIPTEIDEEYWLHMLL